MQRSNENDETDNPVKTVSYLEQSKMAEAGDDIITAHEVCKHKLNLKWLNSKQQEPLLLEKLLV